MGDERILPLAPPRIPLSDCQNERTDADVGVTITTLFTEPLRSSVHKNLDPIIGNCLDCGATHEEIQDNLAPSCDVITGPNKAALMAIRIVIRSREKGIEQMSAALQSLENRVAAGANNLRAARHDLEKLKASFEKLRVTE